MAGSRASSSVPGSDANARARVVKEGMGWAELPFGDDLKADLFYPTDRPGTKWPVVIWLHPYTYQNGWSNASPWESTGSDYRLEQRPSIPAFVKRGFAVLAFDQVGFGARVLSTRETSIAAIPAGRSWGRWWPTRARRSTR